MGVLDEYEWNSPYEIRDEDCTVDGIEVRFPKCTLLFEEGFESEIVDVVKGYQDANEEWKDTPQLSGTDILKAANLHTQAYNKILELNAE